MRHTTYPEYKSVPDRFLPSLPVHWKIERNKRVFYQSRSLVGGNSDEFQLLSLTLKGVIKRDIDSGFGKMPASFDTYQVVSKGDLIFCLFDIDETPRTVGLSSTDGMITGAYDVFKVTASATAEFVYYYYLHIDSFKGLRPYYTGLRKVVRAETFASIKMPLPPLEEQTQIANFLDHETANIDTLIDKQQQLIKLLKEKRQAVISHAVTKGLNPDAKMKDSGVEWLGEVPEHWVISQLKFNTKLMQTGPFGSQLHAEDYVENGIPLINPAHIVNGEIVPNPSVSVDQETQSRLARHKLSGGDLILARRGELGRCAVVKTNQEGWLCGTGSLKATFTSKLISDYAFMLISSEGVKVELSLESKGSTMENLNTETLGRVRLPIPPSSEQHAILNFVEITASKFNQIESLASQQVTLLKERRTALISAAVTGKIDVRNAA